MIKVWLKWNGASYFICSMLDGGLVLRAEEEFERAALPLAR